VTVDVLSGIAPARLTQYPDGVFVCSFLLSVPFGVNGDLTFLPLSAWEMDVSFCVLANGYTTVTSSVPVFAGPNAWSGIRVQLWPEKTGTRSPGGCHESGGAVSD
jgi:hypothetical protein